jgi:lipopolysaccharide export system protein LptC
MPVVNSHPGVAGDAGSPETPGEKAARPLPNGAKGPAIGRSVRSVHTRVVGAGRIVLPLAAAMLLASVLLWPNDTPETASIAVDPGADVSADQPDVVNARFLGTDRKERPFSLTAFGIREMDLEGRSEIALTRPEGELTLEDGSWINVRADTAAYVVASKSLALRGSVTLVHDAGYEIVTSTAHVDVAEGRISGSDRVEGHGPFGEFQADGFQVSDSGDSLALRGSSRVLVRSAAGRSVR